MSEYAYDGTRRVKVRDAHGPIRPEWAYADRASAAARADYAQAGPHGEHWVFAVIFDLWKEPHAYRVRGFTAETVPRVGAVLPAGRCLHVAFGRLFTLPTAIVEREMVAA